MDSFIGFAGIGTAIIASVGLAMWMEWYCLRWLMRLMPGQAGAEQRSSVASSVRERVEFAAIEPELAVADLAGAARGESGTAGN
jgi:hypothetical protein